MDQQNRDLDVALQTLRGLEQQYLPNPDWEHSPFKWLLGQPSGTKGSIARQLLKSWAQPYGKTLSTRRLDYQPYLQSGDDLFLVKFSMLWEGGTYRFQQFKEGPYSFALCLGISPDDIHLWLIPVETIKLRVIGSKGQHTGKDSAETWWFETSPRTPLSWLNDCGGQLSTAGRLLRET